LIMDKNKLAETAKKLVAPGKGIFAADWSLRSSEKHFEKNGIEHNEESRRQYRQMLFATQGIEEFISGVIFFDETIRQKSDKGKLFPQLLKERGIIPGIKVDKGTVDMEGFPGEKVTEGLDGLSERLKEYFELGARFAKWRAVFGVGEGKPTSQCIESNSESMARFAALSQEAGLVPIVEPEVLMTGVHDIARDEEVTIKVLAETFSYLERHKVFIEGAILKTNYVHPGKESGDKVDYQLIAEETFQTLERTVPPNLPGVVFLSGGDSPEESTAHLNAIAKLKKGVPWELSFSYARALQYPAIEIWQGKNENVEVAQKAFYHRVKLNSLARMGKYLPGMEND